MESEWKDDLYLLFAERLNLMLTECLQLNENVNNLNKIDLIKKIVNEIAIGKIRSVHLSKEDAKYFKKIIDNYWS